MQQNKNAIGNWQKVKFRSIVLFFIFNFSFLIFNSVKAQDSSHIRISLLTCTPGEELYSTFGHSALRIVDSSSVTDIVYNYGTFNFDDNGFYLKFIRGKLLYYISTEDFEDFKADYEADHRGIIEQVLNFSAVEKIKIEDYLIQNIKEENKYYKYDFFFDNCTTRLRDIIENNKHPHPIFKRVMPAGSTFRNAIYQYLDKGGEPWSKLGIDILLGAKTDAVMTARQSQFLPENLMKSLDSSNDSLVQSKSNILPINNNNFKGPFFSPWVLFSSILLTIVLLSFSQNNFIKIFLQGFDGIFFFLTGVLGIILIFMWAATDHVLCSDNYNLLWAWPTHSIIAFFIGSKKNWVKKYLIITAIVLLILLMVWAFLPEQLNTSLIPIILLLIYRSISNYVKK